MRIIISISERDGFESSNASHRISEICNYVGADRGESLLIPQPGKLMDVIKILKENDIAYHIQDLPSTDRETL